MFGDAQEAPQSETTAFRPRSPYGVAKLYAYWMTVNFRNTKGLFACNGILFNHESPLRGLEFVTRKITHGLAAIALGDRECVELGNLDSSRDWGFAADYVEGMWRMLQCERPGDYVLATGRSHSVRAFCDTAASYFGLDLAWRAAAPRRGLLTGNPAVPLSGSTRTSTGPKSWFRLLGMLRKPGGNLAGSRRPVLRTSCK